MIKKEEKQMKQTALCIEFGDERIVRLDARNLGIEARREDGSWAPKFGYYARLSGALSRIKHPDAKWLKHRIAELEIKLGAALRTGGVEEFAYAGYRIRRADSLNLQMEGPMCTGKRWYGNMEQAGTALLGFVLTGTHSAATEVLAAGADCVTAFVDAALE